VRANGVEVLEKGEIGIVAGQFIALALVIIILGNYVGPTQNATTTAGKVYWGTPSAGVILVSNKVTTVTSNSSSISMYFSLASGTTIGSASASRLCVNPRANNTGGVQGYTRISINYDAGKKQNYIQFGPTGQALGIGCTYTITVTDSLQQTVTWVGTVSLNSTSSTSTSSTSTSSTSTSSTSS
jgi:hypothetical protein